MGKKVEFGKRFAMIGVISGLALALGVPALALAGHMPYGIVCAIMIVSVLTGGAIILVSSFFGIVLPTVAEDDNAPKKTVVVKTLLGKTTRTEPVSPAPQPQQNGSAAAATPAEPPQK